MARKHVREALSSTRLSVNHQPSGYRTPHEPGALAGARPQAQPVRHRPPPLPRLRRLLALLLPAPRQHRTGHPPARARPLNAEKGPPRLLQPAWRRGSRRRDGPMGAGAGELDRGTREESQTTSAADGPDTTTPSTTRGSAFGVDCGRITSAVNSATDAAAIEPTCDCDSENP